MTRVLVVDDAADIRLLVDTVLTRAGFDVLQAASATEALTLLPGPLPVDVMLLDVQLPGMDGWQTLGVIRDNPTLKDVAVVLFTVKANEDDVARAAALGADGYVSKPFAPDSLVEQVTAVVSARANRLGGG